MKELYPMLFKRKSFRRFNNLLFLSQQEIEKIEHKIQKLVRLFPEETLQYCLVKREETTCKRGEYCILLYGKNNEKTLMQLGYSYEQLDLWLASQNIGACWYGMGKVKPEAQEYCGLPFLTMIAIGKANENEFRKEYTKAKRKDTVEIWQGEELQELGEIVKYAPSACNLQPWLVKAKRNEVTVYRRQVSGSIIPKHKLSFYNAIDMGVFLCVLECTLEAKGVSFTRKVREETVTTSDGLQEIAVYSLGCEAQE